MKRRMRVARWLLFGTLGVVAVVGTLAIAARFMDGPLGPFPGGKLHGTVVTEPVRDWSALLAGVDHLELEVNPTRPRSVTTSYILSDGKLYVPSLFAARKRWPHEVVADGRVVVRIKGTLYERAAVRVTDPAEIRPLMRAHDGAAPADTDVHELSTWYFRMDPRA